MGFEDSYRKEVEERWGETGAFKEYKKKNRSFEQQTLANKRMMEIFAGIGELKNLSPDDRKVQGKIEELKNHITENYYTCTNDMLLSLGQMYVSDERFKQNIDRAGGTGTAEFTLEAIKKYYE